MNDVWHQKEPVVYIMRRADGWHKIGHCYGEAKRRVTPVSSSLPRELRPVTLVRTFKPSGTVTILEVMAHFEMEKIGAERCKHGREWFNATAAQCLRAIKAADKRHQEIGNHGWQLEQRRRYMARVMMR